MEERKQRVVKEGNAFYELDLECMKRREEMCKNIRGAAHNEGKRKRQRD